MKPTGRYCFGHFYSQDPKPKGNHQIASSRGKKRSRRIQTCVKYMGNIICIERNTDVNKSGLKTLKKHPNRVGFSDVIFNFSKN